MGPTSEDDHGDRVTLDLNFAFVSDFADASPKLTAVGIGFDTIYAPSVPATHAAMFAVISVRFSRAEAGADKAFKVSIMNADGDLIAPPMETAGTAEPPPAGFHHRNIQSVVGMYGLTFPNYGDYQVSWLVNGTEMATASIRVAKPRP